MIFVDRGQYFRTALYAGIGVRRAIMVVRSSGIDNTQRYELYCVLYVFVFIMYYILYYSRICSLKNTPKIRLYYVLYCVLYVLCINTYFVLSDPDPRYLVYVLTHPIRDPRPQTYTLTHPLNPYPLPPSPLTPPAR